MVHKIAIVGRPNVGKSTLFNRLTRRRLALVDKTPGLTRDRRQAEAEIGGLTVELIDTAGLEEGGEGTLVARMRAQTEAAIAEADLILFLIDARSGVVPADEEFAALARASGKPTLLVANKCEGRAGDAGFYDAYGLGLGDPVAISAEHGEGLGALYGAIEATAAQAPPAGPAEAADGDEAPPIRIAIVGRPNAGKSTLVNALVGEERMITGPEAGITRDSIAVELDWGGRGLRLFDTAGLRRKARVKEAPEKLSVSDALRAIQFAEVVVLLLDAASSFEKQDLQIADLVAGEGRALVIAVNKWDTVEDKQDLRRTLLREAERLLPQIKGVPVVPVSALRRNGLDRLMDAVFETYETWNRRVSTAALNRWLSEAVVRHPPPAVSGRRIRLRFMTQPNARPPTFVVFSQRADRLPEAYQRYLVNGLREAFDLPGVPIRLNLRKGKNPYEKRR
ncbi:MAG: ribosome biogenesis GTPase Der [Hyphomicrobiales bacterium]|nr:ribosome biogenesis GTPase Der [Hyphomicrobiales bacterium]